MINNLNKKIILILAISFLLVSLIVIVNSQNDNYYNYGSSYNNPSTFSTNYGSGDNQNNQNNQYSNYPQTTSSYSDYYNRNNNGYNTYGSSVNPQFYPPGYSGFDYNAGNFQTGDSYQCASGQDLILQIAPGGCQPSVVRSDLLEEQNVPVFCKLSAVQVNPLIDISRIRSIQVRGSYPAGVSGLSYYPARAAIGGKKVFENSIYDDNLGYVVIVLSRQVNESSMPDSVEGNISAIVNYETEASFGVGEPFFYLQEMSDEEWLNNYRDYGFWNGKGYIRVDSIEGDTVTISVYRDVNTRQQTVTLRKGQTSSDIFLSGFYCAAGLRLYAEKIDIPRDSALLQINGMQTEVALGDKILDNCRISKLETYGVGGKVSIACPGKETINLELVSGKAVFVVNEQTIVRQVGETIQSNIYLAYYGQDSTNERYAVLVSDSTERSFNDKNFFTLIEKTISERDNLQTIEKKISELIKNYNKKPTEEISAGVIAKGKSFSGIQLQEVILSQDKPVDYEQLSDKQKLSLDYYELSASAYEELIDLYPQEKMSYTEEDPYAAKGLLDIARLSRTLRKDERAQEYYNRLLNDYSDSYSAQTALFEQRNMLKYDTTKAQASISLANNHYFVNLLDFKKPAEKDLNAVLSIDGVEYTFNLREKISITRDNKVHSFRVVSIKDDYVDLEYEHTAQLKKQRVKKNQQLTINGISVRLVETHSNKQVKLKILSKGYGPQVSSQFKFGIGIEKRALQTSPEQAKQSIKNLKETIASINEINGKLGKVISGMKAACFATSAVLSMKNTFAGGDAIGRIPVMTNAGGWNDKCQSLVNEKKYQTVHECLLAHKDEIEKDVGIYTTNIKTTNILITGGKKVTDIKQTEEEFKKVFEEWCKNQQGAITLPNQEKTTLTLGTSENSVCKWETLTHEQRRDIMMLVNTKNSGSDVLKEMTNTQLGKVGLETKQHHDEYIERIISTQEGSKYNLSIQTTNPVGESITQGYIKTITSSDGTHNVYSKFAAGTRVVRIFIPTEKVVGNQKFEILESVKNETGGKEVIVEVVYSENSNYYYPKENGKVVLVDGTPVSDEAAKEARRYMSLAGLTKIKQSDKKAYQNKMLNPEKLKVLFFESAPYKGLPAEIPFDIENGWYVEMSYALTERKPYDDSGKVSHFYICNVGENGLIEFKKSADDICRYYSSEIGDSTFPGLSAAESRTLLEKAQRSIQDASRQYGKSKITINGKTFDSGMSFSGEEGLCTDFMSISDCTLLFNVCDPVICPASRCDFGGKYRVDNVIQSGVAGSLLLCLPNYKEGVAVPICLSGVHAGLESYASILNSTVSCLNESIATGKTVGICDEIKSIYLCEFFWRQAAPLAEVALPRLFDSFSGLHGGGEYLTINNAWGNTKNAMNYFSQVYAINSLKAFSSRNLNDAGTEVGTQICKSFVSINFGDFKNFFNKLIQPDSPVQFSAWFSENQMTSATVPPISHYKVYYHIYAGNDTGAYYIVYLKDVAATTGVNTLGSYIVDRGYITRGSQVDNARDFTATSGFKQLCVNVNGQDYCGFGKVSTSYALNSLSESFVAEELRETVKTEQECIAGTPSFGSLLTPNIQSGINEVINPELYNQGIIRICSSENPGKQALPSGSDRTNSSYSRWREVGYCDDPTIKCWLDTQSVKEVVRDKGLEEAILQNVDITDIEKGNYLTYEESKNIGDRAYKFIAEFKVKEEDTRESISNKLQLTVSELTKLSQIGITNAHRARAHYSLGTLYKKVTEELWKGVSDKIIFDSVDVINVDEFDDATQTPSASDLNIEYNQMDNGPVLYTLDSQKNIIDSSGKETGYYLRYTTYGTAIERAIYEKRDLFGVNFMWPDRQVGILLNNKITFDVDSAPWSDAMKQLNELSFDDKTRSFSRQDSVNPSSTVVTPSVSGTKSFSDYSVDEDNSIMLKDQYTGYFIKRVGTEVILYYEGEFYNELVVVAGKLIDNKVAFEVEHVSLNEHAKKLNGLYLDEKTKRFYEATSSGGSGLPSLSAEYVLRSSPTWFDGLVFEYDIYKDDTFTRYGIDRVDDNYILKKKIGYDAQKRTEISVDVGVLKSTENVNLKKISVSVPQSEQDEYLRSLHGLRVDFVNYKIY